MPSKFYWIGYDRKIVPVDFTTLLSYQVRTVEDLKPEHHGMWWAIEATDLKYAHNIDLTVFGGYRRIALRAHHIVLDGSEQLEIRIAIPDIRATHVQKYPIESGPDKFYLDSKNGAQDIKVLQLEGLIKLMPADDPLFYKTVNAFVEHSKMRAKYATPHISTTVDRAAQEAHNKKAGRLEEIMMLLDDPTNDGVYCTHHVLDETERAELRNVGYVCETLVKDGNKVVTLIRR